MPNSIAKDRRKAAGSSSVREVEEAGNARGIGAKQVVFPAKKFPSFLAYFVDSFIACCHD